MSERLLIGIAGAIVGVIGWLFVGMYLGRRERTRKARNAGRAVIFELGASDLPTEARETALRGVLDAHRVALGLVRDRVFTAQEVRS
jgi:hypothetical protein